MDKIMSKQFHGVTSLGLLVVAIVIATVAMFLTSWVLGIVYLVVCVATSASILYIFCTKCPCKAHCGHVFPGKAAMLIKRQPGPCTITELAVVVLSLLLLIGLSQIWLWQYSDLLTTSWILNVIAMIQIRTTVCRACDNVYCPVNRRYSLAKNQ